MPDTNPLYLPIAQLQAAYRVGDLSPVEVVRQALERIDAFDDVLHAFLVDTRELAMQQARGAEAAYARGEERPLLGVPVAVKDAFHVAGHVTTLGSRLHVDDVRPSDSGVAARLRRAGAVFVGKTNTAEFGQSATTDNLLRPDCANPWDPSRTPGGSSGGSAAAVAAGMATAAVGSDGGGSIRIPAAFTGLVGVKPSVRVVTDEDGFAAMSDFVSPGPLAWRSADVRRLLEVLLETALPRRVLDRPLRIAVCEQPEGRPVHPGIVGHVRATAAALADAGHRVDVVDLPLQGWNEVFGPLVLHDEWRHRGHLLDEAAAKLTEYERRTLEAAATLDAATVDRARAGLATYRHRITSLFAHHDVLMTPTTAVPAFQLGERPETIAGEPVGSLWGAFPFAVPFNVAGTPAASVPVGLVDGLPVGVQLVAAYGHDWGLLDAAELVEELVAFDASPVHSRWSVTGSVTPA